MRGFLPFLVLSFRYLYTIVLLLDKMVIEGRYPRFSLSTVLFLDGWCLYDNAIFRFQDRDRILAKAFYGRGRGGPQGPYLPRQGTCP